MSRFLLKSSSLFASNTFISRMLGFVRDVIFAHFFGADAALDAFLVAFRIPNFMRRLFAEGAFSQAFVPVLSDYKHHQNASETQRFINDMMGSLASVLLLFTLLGMLIAPWIITVFAPGFAHQGDRFVLAYHMLRITFPYLLLISMVALCAAVLNTYGIFGAPAFAPVLLNVSLISSALWLSPHFKIPVEALAWGVFVAGILQLIYLFWVMWRKQLLPRPKINFKDPGVRRVLKLMGPAIFGVSVAQVNLLLDTVFASFLVIGSVSWLYFSERLMMFPLGIFGVAISTVILPSLSKHVSQSNHDQYSKTLDWALRVLLLVGLPAVLALFILAGPILTALFQYHAFTVHDVLMSRESLMAFAVGLQAFMLIKVLAAGFYAHKNIQTPVKIGVVAMITNMLLNALFILPLHHAGIALATSLSGILNAFLLWRGLKRRGIYQAQSGWSVYLSRLCVANAVLAVILLLFVGHLSTWLSHGAAWRLVHLFTLIIVGIIAYIVALLISGMRLTHFLLP